MARKETMQQALRSAIDLAIDVKSEDLLRKAVADAQAFDKRGVLGRTLSWGSRKWAEAQERKTPLGVCIDEQWLAGVQILAPVSSMMAYHFAKLPLAHCAEIGWVDGLRTVAKQGLVDAEHEGLGQTAIMAAAYHGKASCVAELISLGARVHRGHGRSWLAPLNADKQKKWISPLHAAASGGCSESTKLLLAAGAGEEPNGWQVSEKASAVDLALLKEKPSWEVAHRLIAANAFPVDHSPAKNEHGQTALMAIMSDPKILHEALSFNEHGFCAESLLWWMLKREGFYARDAMGLGVINYANREDSFSGTMDFKRRMLELAGVRKPLILSEEELDSACVKEFSSEGFDLGDLATELFRRDLRNHAFQTGRRSHAATSSSVFFELDTLAVARDLTLESRAAQSSEKPRAYAQKMAEQLAQRQREVAATLSAQAAKISLDNVGNSEKTIEAEQAIKSGAPAKGSQRPGAARDQERDPASQQEMDAAVAQCLEAMGSMAAAMARLAGCVNAREEKDQAKESAGSAELRDASLGIMGRANKMRDQMRSLAAKAEAPRKTG